MGEGRSLDERLAAAGVPPGADPLAAWRRLHAAEGRRATVIDLYELVARERGLAARQLPADERLALARGAMPEVWPGFAQTGGSERGPDPLREDTGLQLRSRDVLHRYFRPVADRPRDVHVHVCDVGSEWEREHLLFRDYLRAHAGARDAYAAAKRAAAVVWSDDWIAYTDAKTAGILPILEAAEAWAATSWDEDERRPRS